MKPIQSQSVYLKDDELKVIQNYAQALGLSVSSYLRMAALQLPRYIKLDLGVSQS